MGRSYLNVDMGLYRKFEVDEEKGYRPMNCGVNQKGNKRADDWWNNKPKRAGRDSNGKKLDNQEKLCEQNPPENHYYKDSYFRYTSQSTKAGDLAAERNCLVVQDEFYCGCGINDDLTDDGNQMMYEIVEEFAKLTKNLKFN